MALTNQKGQEWIILVKTAQTRGFSGLLTGMPKEALTTYNRMLIAHATSTLSALK